MFVDIQRLGTWSVNAATAAYIQYPHYYSEIVFPLVWGVGVDKIIGVRFQQNNTANAARNFNFWMTLEKLFY